MDGCFDGYGVYVIFRPDGRPCYVGKGKYKRPQHHFSKFTGNPYLSRVIKGAGGTLPWKWIVTGLTEAEAWNIERTLICCFGRTPKGPLVNMTNGGEGVAGLKFSAEHKAKLSEVLRNRVRRPETYELISAKLKGRHLSEEHIRKMAERERSAEERAKMSAAKKGKPGRKLSPESRAKVSATRIARGHGSSKEHLEKLRLLHLGSKHTPEHNSKIGASGRGLKRSPEAIANLTAA